MKKFLLLAFIFSIQFLQAQDYQNICTKGTTFYRSPSNEFMAFRRDSIVVNTNNDTTFFSYRAIRDTSAYNCADTTNGSVLGLKIVKTHSGWFYFFNRIGDTIKINTLASFTDSWKFCILSANGYIEAKVTSLENDSVLGIIDPVKVITFQAKDSAGNAVSHVLNGRSIRLSQHYGLATMLDVYYIPGDTNILVLDGKTIPKMGVQDLTWQEIYNYNVGNIFHYYLSAAGNQSTIYKVLSKTANGNDSVTYVMEHCSKFLGSTYFTVHDTLVFTYPLTPDPDFNWLPRLPREFIRQNQYAELYTFSLNAVQNLRVKSVSSGYVFSKNSCWIKLGPGEYNVIAVEERYSEGLGRTRFYYYENDNGQIQQANEDMVYYKKGSETWGTPLATDCFSLVGVEPVQLMHGLNVRITPNPVRTQAEIQLQNPTENESYYFSIRDIYGRVIIQRNFDSNPYILFRDGIPAGMYFLSVQDQSGTAVWKSKILFE
jgi:hypothetical protein